MLEKGISDSTEEVLNRGFIIAGDQIRRQYRYQLNAKAVGLLDGCRSRDRISVPQELSIGISVPFTGKFAGNLVFVCPWAMGQTVWTQILGSAPLTPQDLNVDHLRLMIEAAKSFGIGFGQALQASHQLPVAIGQPVAAVDMAPAIMQTMTIEAVRLKRNILPFTLEVGVEDTIISGQMFLVSEPKSFLMLASKNRVAA